MSEPSFDDRLAALRGRIAAAAGRSGRPAGAVRLIGAAKTIPADRLSAAVAAGLTDLGENRVQEAEEKIPAVVPCPTWHLIGHLQSNKARRAAALFDCIQTIDSVRLAGALDRHVDELGRSGPLDVLIEVNVSGEAAKHGVEPVDAPALIAAVRRDCPRLALRGLMTVGPLVEEADAARPAYQTLARLARSAGLHELSMGMSGDFEVAIEEGATMVRVGSALFGARG